VPVIPTPSFGTIFCDFSGSASAISVAQSRPTQLALTERRIQLKMKKGLLKRITTMAKERIIVNKYLKQCAIRKIAAYTGIEC